MAVKVSNTLLSVSNLTTWLGDASRPVRVVDALDLTIRHGETVALLGESGCGKSMTALSLMRLLPPSGRITAGRVRLGGTELLDLPESAMRQVRGGRMGMIFQEPQTSLNPVLTVGRQIAEAVQLHAHPSRRRVRGRVLELIDAVGIPDPARRVGEYPHQLSGGMKQRVMIAMALAGDPELLIADEPTTALDVTIQAQVLRLLKGLQRETGMAVLLITHDLGVVSETADRLAVMYAGQIVETATSEAFFAGPSHPYSRKLLDSLPTPKKRAESLAVIPGRVPPLDRPFPGCRFAPRCDRVLPHCHEVEPPWAHPAAGHAVRCHLWAGANNRPPSEALAAPPPPRADRPSPPPGRPMLSVERLQVHFPIHAGLFRRVVGHVKAVDGVDMELGEARTLALVGESGCGKTTIGKGILQLLRPTGGAVRYDGRDLVGLGGRAMRRYRKDLQIIFQDPFASMNPRMLVGDIVGEGLQALRLEPRRAARRARVRELLDQVGMPAEAAERYPHEFSGGQRQRICIARALAVQPRVIVCDEPTSALDVSVQAQILNLLKRLQDELGLAYLFITHNISVVSYLAHEVAVMYLGRIVERGTVAEVLEDPRHPYTRALLSAVPVVDRNERRQVIRLDGDMPSPVAPPPGCHFHPRCPEALPQCAQAYPSAVRLSDTRSVHCVRVQPGPSPREAGAGLDDPGKGRRH
jgi:peptide/nickel transport system ATP-binding protein